MNVREDKMTNSWGLQVKKNIFLDVVKWVVSQTINKRGLFYNF